MSVDSYDGRTKPGGRPRGLRVPVRAMSPNPTSGYQTRSRDNLNLTSMTASSIITPDTSISPRHRRISEIQRVSTPENARANSPALKLRSPLSDNLDSDASFLNDSLLGALDEVEKREYSTAADKDGVFNASDDDMFANSFLEDDEVKFQIKEESDGDTEKKVPVITPQKISRRLPNVQPPVKRKKPHTKKPKKRRKFTVAYTNRKVVQQMSASRGSELSKDELSWYSEEDKLLLSSWGLPDSVVTRYRMKGITSLFQWQLECLTNDNVFAGKNLLYSAPTSAGKTLVAEILTLKRVMELGKKAIIILPFISVAREKMYSLQELFGDAGVKVEGFMGSYNPPGGFKMVDIAVCTIEKANSLINRLLTDNLLHQLGTVVVDELHLVGDSHRGYLLELLLTKLKFMNGRKMRCPSDTDDRTEEKLQEITVNIQIIGMSATLPNLSTLATWLDAELVISSYRPVPLIEHILCSGKIYNSDLQEMRELPSKELPLNLEDDPTFALYLTLETVTQGHSILIFCPTKAWCETLAEQIARLFFKIGRNNSNYPPEVTAALRSQLNTARISEVIEQLNQSAAGKDNMLVNTASYGVAFHHAGLTMDERDILESAFKRNTIRVICATQTLSAGVNLPARRVIIMSPIFNGMPLDPLTYKQMSGRAGRKGVDTEGESIVLCTLKNYEIAHNLLQSTLPSVKSTLMGNPGNISSSLKRALLEVVASGVAKTADDVALYAQSTLSSVCSAASDEESSSSQENCDSVVKQCLDFLSSNEYIKLTKYEDTEKLDYLPTQLGAACLASSLSPDEGLVVFKELLKARRNFVLTTDLHIIYQVTPIYLSDQWKTINWQAFLDILDKLPEDDRLVGNLVGIDLRFMTTALMGAVSARNPLHREKLSIHQRFYTALALNDLVNEMPISKVCEKYDVNKGTVQNLQQAASTFAGMVTSFCGKLGWKNLELVLSQFQDRLQFGVQRELCDLVRLSTLNGRRARILYSAGIETVADLAACDPAHIEVIFRKSNPFASTVHGSEEQQTVFIQGKTEALTEEEAAKLVVSEARQFLQAELGLKSVEFQGEKSETSENQKNSKIDQLQNSMASLSLSIISNPTADNIPAISRPSVHGCTPDSEDLSLRTSTPGGGKSQPGTEFGEHAMLTCNLEEGDIWSEVFFERSFSTETPEDAQRSQSSLTTVQLSPAKNALNHDGKLNTANNSICSMDMSFNMLQEADDQCSPTLFDSQSDECPAEDCRHNGLPNKKSSSSNVYEISSCLDVSGASTDLFSDNEHDHNSVSTTSMTSCKAVEPALCQKSNYSDLQLNGRTISVYQLDAAAQVPLILEASKSEDIPVSFGIQITTITQSDPPRQSIIGGKIMGHNANPERRKKDQFKILCCVYQGGERLWVHEANFEASKKHFTLQQTETEKVIDAVLQFPHPLVILNAKSKFHKMIKLLAPPVWEKMIRRPIWDPRIAAWLSFDSEMEADDLEGGWVTPDALISAYLPEEGKSIQESGWNRNMQETFASWLIMKELKQKLKEIRLWNHFEEVEMACITPIAFMETNGFAFDCTEYRLLQQRLRLHSALLELKAFDAAGRYFNLGSSKEIRKILFEDLKLQRPPNSRGTGKEVLARIDHVVPSVVSEWRKVQHALSLIGPYSDAQNPETKRIHGIYAFFTCTGRIIMAEPSIQYIPRDFDLKISFSRPEINNIRKNYRLVGPQITKLLTEIEECLRYQDENSNNTLTPTTCKTSSISMRNAFKATSEDYILLSADYSQLELRVLAILCKDENLTQVLNSGQDVFRLIAAGWKNLPSEKVDDELRQRAKAVVYAIIYGMGENSLAQKMDISAQEARNYIDKFLGTYPKVKTFVLKTIRTCETKGYVETITGRRRYLPNITSKDRQLKAQAERQAVNTAVQGSASDLVKKAMLNVQQCLDNFSETYEPSGSTVLNDDLPGFLVLNLHDELILEIRKDALDTLVPLVRAAMEKPLVVPVILPVNVKCGQSWGSMTPYIETEKAFDRYRSHKKGKTNLKIGKMAQEL